MKPTYVAIVNPPLDKSGGMGSLTRYSLGALPEGISAIHLDSRGFSPNPWLSALPLVNVLRQLTWRKLTHKLDVVQVNLTSGGSAVRKLSVLAWTHWLLRTPVIVQGTGSIFATFYGQQPRPVQRLMRFVLRRARLFIMSGDIWVAEMQGITNLPSDRFRIVPYGVPELVDQSLRQLDSETKSAFPIALFSGQFVERKGIGLLIEAMTDPRLRTLRLVAAGYGDMAEWQEQATALGVIDRVAFVGHLPAQGVHRLLNVVDVLVLPSANEGLSLAILEAFSAQCAVVGTSVGALAEYDPDATAYVRIPERSAPVLADILSRLFESGERAVALSGYELWKRHFNVLDTNALLREIWSSVARKAGSRQ